jgi:hypothetical protein
LNETPLKRKYVGSAQKNAYVAAAAHSNGSKEVTFE